MSDIEHKVVRISELIGIRPSQLSQEYKDYITWVVSSGIKYPADYVERAFDVRRAR